MTVGTVIDTMIRWMYVFSKVFRRHLFISVNGRLEQGHDLNVDNVFYFMFILHKPQPFINSPREVTFECCI